MPPSSQASLPCFSESDSVARKLHAQLPLDAARGVRIILAGSDLAAVEAAAAELKVRFGSRFAVTGRSLGPDRQALRTSAGLIANVDNAIDAEGSRQWTLPYETGS